MIIKQHTNMHDPKEIIYVQQASGYLDNQLTRVFQRTQPAENDALTNTTVRRAP